MVFSHICPYLFQTKLGYKEQLQLHKCLTFLCITPVVVLQFWPEETSPAAKEHLTSMIPATFGFLEITNIQNKQDWEHFKAWIAEITARLFFPGMTCQE